MLRLDERTPLPGFERNWAPGYIAYAQVQHDAHRSCKASGTEEPGDPYTIGEVGSIIIPLLLQADEWRSPFWEVSGASLRALQGRVERFDSLLHSQA